MGLFDIVSTIIKPITGLIDNLSTSDEEKLRAKAELTKIHNELAIRFLEHETKAMQERAELIRSEARGESWLQRNWRPITMMAFLILLFLYWFGVHPENLSQNTLDSVFNLLSIGIGGYIVGRSAEKIIPELKK